MTDTPNVIPAYLGWKNEKDDGQNMRLYACDLEKPTAPRWDGPAGRTIEVSLAANNSYEGDRYLVIKVGDRFVSADDVASLAWDIQTLLDKLADR